MTPERQKEIIIFESCLFHTSFISSLLRIGAPQHEQLHSGRSSFKFSLFNTDNPSTYVRYMLKIPDCKIATSKLTWSLKPTVWVSRSSSELLWWNIFKQQVYFTNIAGIFISLHGLPTIITVGILVCFLQLWKSENFPTVQYGTYFLYLASLYLYESVVQGR